MTDFNTEQRQAAQVNYTFKNPRSLLEKAITFFLSTQALFGLYQSVKLIIFERQAINAAISQHQLGEKNINQFVNKAVLTVFSTALSFFFAIRFSSQQAKLSRALQNIIGILIIIANTYIMNFLNQLPLLERLMSLIDFL